MFHNFLINVLNILCVISKYFIDFVVTINKIFFFHFVIIKGVYESSWFLYETVCPTTLPNSLFFLIVFSLILLDFVSRQKDHMQILIVLSLSLPPVYHIHFSCQNALARTSSIRLNDIRHPYRIPPVNGIASKISSSMFTVDFWQLFFIKLNVFSLIPTFMRLFKSKNRYEILSFSFYL